MNKNIPASIIIPNWNGKHLLEKHLPSVIKASQDAEIIIVDDASTDNSVEYLQTSFSKIKLVKKDLNEGFASAVNKGVQEAQSDIIVLLNTDIEPEVGFLNPLLQHFESKDVFAVGCLDKSIEAEKIVLRGRGEASWQEGMFIHRRGEVDKTDTAWVSGGSGAFRKKYWEKLGGMDELFNPFYWEDIDLSYRARKSGYIVLFEPESVVIHKHEEGTIKTSQQEKKVKRIAFRNQLICTWKNITEVSYLLEHVIYLKLRLIQSLFRGDTAFILGYVDALKLLPQVYKKRKQATKMFVKSDSELLPRNFSN